MTAGRAGAAVRAGAVLCGLAVAVLASGCGERTGGPGERVAPVEESVQNGIRVRMEKVAAAWQGSAALTQWREGYHPLDPQDWSPPGGFHSGEDKEAAVNGNFVLRASLPAGLPAPTPVRWADGSELALPLLGAQEVYGQLNQAKGPVPDPEHALPVTAVRFGESAVRTSRGEARVPAWLFTVEGYDAPLVRVAIRPQDLPKPPVEPIATFDAGTSPLSGYTGGAPEATTLTLSAGHGACDGGVAVEVLEGADTVVLAGRILPGEHGPDAPCPAVMLHQEVEVTLTRPVGGRVLLDSASGAPLERGGSR